MVSQTLNWFSAIHETGVTSAAVPVKKHPTKLLSSEGAIFLSCTLIFFNFARFETGSLILPLAKNSLKPEIKISLATIIIAAITS